MSFSFFFPRCTEDTLLSLSPIVFFHPQPYYATRVNAADIENRVQELNKKTSLSEETSKAGFWEEFDVRNCWGALFAFLGILHAPPCYPSSISSCTQISCVSCQFLKGVSIWNQFPWGMSLKSLSESSEVEMCFFMVGQVSHQDSKGHKTQTSQV